MIVFDFDGVISDSLRWFEDVAEAFSSMSGAPASTVLEWMIGVASEPWLTGAWSDEAFLEQFNLAFDAHATMQQLIEACGSSIRIDPSVQAIIERIGPIAIFTDNPAVRAHAIEQATGCSNVTTSQSVGARKRDAGGFERFKRLSGIRSGLFIDDYEPNIEAARHAGFDAYRWRIGKNRYEELERRIKRYLRSSEQGR